MSEKVLRATLNNNKHNDIITSQVPLKVCKIYSWRSMPFSKEENFMLPHTSNYALKQGFGFVFHIFGVIISNMHALHLVSTDKLDTRTC